MMGGDFVLPSLSKSLVASSPCSRRMYVGMKNSTRMMESMAAEPARKRRPSKMSMLVT